MLTVLRGRLVVLVVTCCRLDRVMVGVLPCVGLGGLWSVGSAGAGIL